MKSILITGCNRGIGLGLVKNLVKDKISPKCIMVTCRDVDKAKELKELADCNKNIHILTLDVEKTDTFPDFAKKVEDIVKEDGLNVLINNAGFYSHKSIKLNMIRAQDLMKTFAINSIGPLMLTKELQPLLKRAASVNDTEALGFKRAVVLNMSSSLGSLSMNVEGGLYPYRCSKVALNMITKSLSVDLKRDKIIVTSIHPGWVKTDMGGLKAPLEVDQSTKGILELLKSISKEHNGGFYTFEGKKMDW